MQNREPESVWSRAIDRDLFARNFVQILEELSDAELAAFLHDTREQNAGTEVEAVLLELMEGHTALREIRRAPEE